VRCENGYRSGNIISANYDPMIAKIIAWGNNRAEATARLIAALKQITLLGITSNRDYLLRILASDAFARGDTTTGFVRDYAADLVEPEFSENELAQFAAAYLLARSNNALTAAGASLQEHSAWVNSSILRLT
jgi:acetyl/propionyl-CoA carboxylase alpha subunit